MVPGNLKDVFWWWRGLSNQRLLNVAHSPCILDSFHPMDALGACLRFACTYWYLLRVADVALLHPFPEVCVEDIRELLLIPCWHYHVLWGDGFFSSFPNVTSHVSLFRSFWFLTIWVAFFFISSFGAFFFYAHQISGYQKSFWPSCSVLRMPRPGELTDQMVGRW